jgi:peptidyl-prolyl cis-trans isomerase A (cyclophilin A)
MKRFAAFCTLAVLLTSCSGSKQNAPQESAALSKPAPDTYTAQFDTSKGTFVVEVTRAWAPYGADRFYDLVQQHFYDDARFFRVLKGFVVQFGINKDPDVETRWRNNVIPDDPVRQTNARGTITFATSGPNTRTTQLFINLADNSRLDQSGFSPFGKVVQGMEVVDQLYSGYGEGEPQGEGPNQEKIEARGNEYLNADFPRLDYIKTVRIVP